MISEWAGPYVGIRYKDRGRDHDGCDCWGLVKLIYHEQFHIELPDYLDAYSHANNHVEVTAAVNSGLKDGWLKVDKPQPGDLMIINIASRPWHCAIMVDTDKFMHAPDTGTVCIERTNRPTWSKRIEGFYRHD